MHTTVEEGMALAQAVCAAVSQMSGVDIAVLPPSRTSGRCARCSKAPASGSARRTSSTRTPAPSPARSHRRCSPGWCDLALVGHSERRHIFGERDDEVGKKFVASLAHGLQVIVAVGETSDERDAGSTFDVVDRQLDAVFAEIDDPPSAMTA